MLAPQPSIRNEVKIVYFKSGTEQFFKLQCLLSTQGEITKYISAGRRKISMNSKNNFVGNTQKYISRNYNTLGKLF